VGGTVGNTCASESVPRIEPTITPANRRARNIRETATMCKVLNNAIRLSVSFPVD
jgi:hypothetical protein